MGPTTGKETALGPPLRVVRRTGMQTISIGNASGGERSEIDIQGMQRMQTRSTVASRGAQPQILDQVLIRNMESSLKAPTITRRNTSTAPAPSTTPSPSPHEKRRRATAAGEPSLGGRGDRVEPSSSSSQGRVGYRVDNVSIRPGVQQAATTANDLPFLREGVVDGIEHDRREAITTDEGSVDVSQRAVLSLSGVGEEGTLLARHGRRQAGDAQESRLAIEGVAYGNERDRREAIPREERGDAEGRSENDSHREAGEEGTPLPGNGRRQAGGLQVSEPAIEGEARDEGGVSEWTPIPNSLKGYCKLCPGRKPLSCRSYWAEHCGRAHAHLATIAGLRRCEHCWQFLLLTTTRRHQCSRPVGHLRHSGEDHEGAPAGEEEIAARREQRRRDRWSQGETPPEDMRATFRTGLYNLHQSWQGPFFDLVMACLEGMVHHEERVCRVNTAALFLLPGLVAYVNLHKVSEGRPIDLLRDLVGNQGDSAGCGERILARARLAYERRPSLASGHRGSTSTSAAVDKLLAKAERSGREGRLSQAATMVDRAGHLLAGEASADATLNWTTEQRRAKLATLYPGFRSLALDGIPAGGPITGDTPCVQVTGSQVMDGLGGVRKDAAPGASGWTNNALRFLRTFELLRASQRDPGTPVVPTLGDRLAGVYNKLYRGEMPASVMLWWTEIRSVLLPKPVAGQPMGARPLGIGDCLTRLASRLALRSVSAKLAEKLMPHQLAVGVKAGCEIGAETVRRALERTVQGGTGGAEESPGFLSVDVRNAFNELPVGRILHKLEEICPELVPYVRWTYSQPTTLVNSMGEPVGKRYIGLQQGCPMGTALCGVAMMPIAACIVAALAEVEADVAAEGGHALSSHLIGFADDNNIVGSLGVLTRVLPRLAGIYADEGLVMVAHKSLLVGERVRELRAADIPEGCQISSAGGRVLGSPVGTPEFVRDFLEMRSAEIIPQHQALRRVSARLQLALIRLVYNARAVFLLRGVRPDQSADFAGKVDRGILQAVATLVGLPVDDPTLGTLLRLPIKFGGLGIHSHAGVYSERGWLCVQALAREYITQHVQGVTPLDLMGGPLMGGFLGQGTDCGLSEEERILLELGSPEDVDGCTREVVARVHAAGAHRFRVALAAAGDKSRYAHYLSGSAKEAGAWCCTLTGLESGERGFTSAHFVHSLRARLLTPLTGPDGVQLQECGCCTQLSHPSNTHLRDVFTHAYSCKQNGAWCLRHDRLRDKLAMLLKHSLGHSQRDIEPKVTVEEEVTWGGGRMAMDVVARKGDHTYWVDVAVCDAGGPAHTSGPLALLKELTGTSQREASKTNIVARRFPGINLADPAHCFVPFALEGTGRIGNAARNFLTDVGVTGVRQRIFMDQASSLLANFGGRMLNKVHTLSVQRAKQRTLEGTTGRGEGRYRGENLA